MRTMYSFRQSVDLLIRRLISLILTLTILGLILVWFISMRDLIDELVVNELEFLVTDIINSSVYDCLDKTDYSLQNITIIDSNSEEKANTVSIDPVKANMMKSHIASEINDRVNKITDDDVNITLGMVIGYCNLGSWGPEIPLAVLPNTNVEIDFENDFISTGINQVLNSLKINVNVHVSALMPFLKCTSTIHSSAIVSQTIIVGDVPDTYIEIEDLNYDR